MKDNFRDLLAGYATGTLTEAEKKALFEAALHDPELFAEIANEEPLRELLASPVARAELLERVEPAEPGFLERLAGWMRRPVVLAAATAVAVGVAVVTIVPAIRNMDHRPQMVAGIVNPPSGGTAAPAAPSEPEAAAPRAPAAEPKAKQPAAPRQASPRKPSMAATNGPATGHIGGQIGIAQVANAETASRSGAAANGVGVYVPGRALEAGAVKSFAAPPAAVAPTTVAMAPPPPPAPVAVAKSMAPESAFVPLRYEVEARTSSGDFVATANAADLKDGDLVRVRFRPSVAGLITVRDASADSSEPMFTRLVSASSDVFTEPILMDRDRRLEVAFTRVNGPANDAGGAARNGPASGSAPAISAMRAAAPRARLSASPATDTNGRMTFSIELRRKP